MTWTRLGDDFIDRPELLAVSRSARLLHVEALIYCNKYLLDGALPYGALRRITDADDPEQDAKALLDAAVWQEAESGWLIEWTDQESAERVRARQEYRAEVQERYRDRKARHARGDHSMCDPRYCPDTVTGNATSLVNGHESSKTPLPAPSRPVPSRPEGTGTGTRGADPARAAAQPGDTQQSEATRRLPSPHPFSGLDLCCALPREHPVHNIDQATQGPR